MLGVVSLLTACSNERAGTIFFPLAPGQRWYYQIEPQTMDGTARLRSVVDGGEPSMVTGYNAATDTTIDGTTLFYRRLPEGVFHIASRAHGGDGAQVHESARLILPSSPQPGTAWR